MKEKNGDCLFDYRYLRAYVYSSKQLGNIGEFAKLLGISRQAIYMKMKGCSDFTQSQIMMAKRKLGLTDEEVCEMFFNASGVN